MPTAREHGRQCAGQKQCGLGTLAVLVVLRRRRQPAADRTAALQSTVGAMGRMTPHIEQSRLIAKPGWLSPGRHGKATASLAWQCAGMCTHVGHPVGPWRWHASMGGDVLGRKQRLLGTFAVLVVLRRRPVPTEPPRPAGASQRHGQDGPHGERAGTAPCQPAWLAWRAASLITMMTSFQWRRPAPGGRGCLLPASAQCGPSHSWRWHVSMGGSVLGSTACWVP